MASAILMAVLALSSVTIAAAQQPPSFNTTFQPWEVMGPVSLHGCTRAATAVHASAGGAAALRSSSHDDGTYSA